MSGGNRIIGPEHTNRTIVDSLDDKLSIVLEQNQIYRYLCNLPPREYLYKTEQSIGFRTENGK